MGQEKWMKLRLFTTLRLLCLWAWVHTVLAKPQYCSFQGSPARRLGSARRDISSRGCATPDIVWLRGVSANETPYTAPNLTKQFAAMQRLFLGFSYTDCTVYEQLDHRA